MKSKRLLFQLRGSTHLTKGKDFTLLLTPSTVDIVPDENRMQKRIDYRNSIGRQWTAGSLTEQVFHQLLPTPMAQNRETTLEKTLERKKIYGGIKRAMYLENYAAMGLLPIPLQGNIIQNSQTGTDSQLNPLFVAEMMGFPTDWTILPFQNGETKALKDMEMP
jgi:hypothetical protein